MTKREMIELAVIEGVCGGGALLALTSLSGGMTHFTPELTATAVVGVLITGAGLFLAATAGRGRTTEAA